MTYRCVQWTTDQDVMDAVFDLGVNDIFEVKFFENRANGQSKGFCVITLGSDSSVRAVIEKLPKRYSTRKFTLRSFNN